MAKIYISGAITGLDYEEAESNFIFAAGMLEALGHETVNPMDNVNPDLTWAEYMAADIVLLDGCDAIYMLLNWRESKGAKIEHCIAEVLEKPIYYAASRIPKIL